MISKKNDEQEQIYSSAARWDNMARRKLTKNDTTSDKRERICGHFQLVIEFNVKSIGECVSVKISCVLSARVLVGPHTRTRLINLFYIQQLVLSCLLHNINFISAVESA